LTIFIFTANIRTVISMNDPLDKGSVNDNRKE